jgi:hypothetical protein
MSRVPALTAAILIAGFWSSAAEAGWGVPYLFPPRPARPAAHDQSWLNDVPEKPGARSRGKVAVFAFSNDDVYQPVREAVVQTLRRRGLNVIASLRPVDSVVQYREMSQALNLAVFVDGELRGEGARQSAVIRVRSGVSGQHITAAKFSGPTAKIVGEINRRLWAQVGSTVSRACTSVLHARRPVRAPLHIDAGSPLDSVISSNGT